MLRAVSVLSAVLVCFRFAAVAPLQACENERRPVNNSAAGSDVSVKIVEFHGWKNAVRLRNRVCEMVVVPEISRVMYFGLLGGPNLIWVAPSAKGQVYTGEGKDWRNLGGDKIWPEPQPLWGWPPPYHFDNAQSAAELFPGGVRLRTADVGPRLGSVLVREFVLDPEKALVTVRQRFEKIQGEPIPMTLWTITQVCKADYALLPLGPENEAKRRFRPLNDSKLAAPQFQVHDSVLSLRYDDHLAAKVGVSPNPDDANGWVAAVFPGCLLLESRQVDVNAAHPDDNSHAELFSASLEHGPYYELELLSPLKALKPGEQLADDCVWQIVPLTDAQAKDPEAAGTVARQAHATALHLIR